MAFGLKRDELNTWKHAVRNGEIAFLTHYWLDDRFPGCDTVTKAGCANIAKLEAWGKKYGLRKEWIHRDDTYPHFDLFGDKQKKILTEEGCQDQLNRFQ